MELRSYWDIMWQRRRLVLILPALVAVLTLLLAVVLPHSYTAQTAMFVTLRPIGTPGNDMPDQDYYYNLLASEYMVDDSLQLVKSQRFAEDVSAWIAATHNTVIDPEDIAKNIDSERRHRTVYLDVTAPTEDQAIWIAQGATTLLTEKGLDYWKREGFGTQLQVAPVDIPTKANPVKGLLAVASDVVLRSLLALIVGAGLAFLLHYLDQSIRRPTDVEALGFEIVGTIPALERTKR